MDGGRKHASSLEPFVCAIPLKPTDDPLKEDQVQKMKKLISDEYALRYLESIGASTTPANIARIKSEIPVSRFKLTAAFKSRGGLEDVFYMQNVEPKNESRHLWKALASRTTFSDMVDKRLAPVVAAAEQRRSQQEGAEKERNKKGWDDNRSSGHRSILPKLNTAAAVSASLPVPARPAPMSPARRDDIASRVALARMGAVRDALGDGALTTRSAKSRQARRVQVFPGHDDAAPADVGPPRLMVTIEDILSIQTMFARTFPLAHIQDRMTGDEMSMLVGELTGIPMADLVLNLTILCEWALLHDGDPPEPHPLARTPAERAGGLLLSKKCEGVIIKIYEGWCDIQGRVQRRQQVVLAYPIYLMLLRVCIETVMRNGVDFLFRDPAEEMNVLNALDMVISFLLDPDGYLNYPPPAPPGKTFSETETRRIAESLAGIPQQSNIPWSTTREHKVHPVKKFHTVSPMMRNLFSNAKSPQLRIMMNKGKKTNTLQAQLSSRSQPDAMNQSPSRDHSLRNSRESSPERERGPHGNTIHAYAEASGPRGAFRKDDLFSSERRLSNSSSPQKQNIRSPNSLDRSNESMESIHGAAAEDIQDMLTRIIRPENLHSMYMIALKKREYRREMLAKQRPKAHGEPARQTQEEKEEEILHTLLPMGVDLLKVGRAA